MTKKSEIVLNDVWFNFSWDKDGINLLFQKKINDKMNVCKLNLDTQNEEILFIGKDPKYSNNGKYLSYIIYGSNDILVIKELETGKEYRYKSYNVINAYEFSPDTKYVAVIENKKMSKDMVISVVDYINGAKSELFNSTTHLFQLDWK